MSVRAYKINRIDHEQSETFNLWHNTFIVDNLVDTEQLNYDGSGIVEVNGKLARELLANIDIEWDNTRYEDESKANTIKILEQIIKDCEPDDYCSYYCF